MYHRLAPTIEADPHLLDVGREQGQGREGGGANRKALAGGGRGVTERVESVGPLAHHFRKPGHLGVAAGIVGDRPVGVSRERDAQGREHTHGGDAHAVQAQCEGVGVGEVEAVGEAEREQRGRARDQHRRPGAQHALGDAADDDRRRTGKSLISQLPRRLELVARRIFGPLADQPARGQTDDHRYGDAHVRPTDEHPGQHERGARDRRS